MIRTSGIFGFLIMLVAFIMVAIIMTIGLQLRRENFLPASFVEQFEQRLQAKDYQGAFEVAKESDSFIGRILTRGMSRVGTSLEEAEAGMQEVGEDETMAMEHKLSYLALISSIAPMLGLLGTVTGMVYSFQAIAGASSSPRPSELADGIATALFTTLEGMVVAIPAVIFYNLYRNRLARFLMECGFVANSMIKKFPKAVRS
jgi:biopolymer transport protein ExbB